ncbi:hypothetical protein M9434_006333 [Picochlorum sp. BPE23]|nr:hypothetical protein M9434_006333 [Picochlorum sp. BPE23]
MRAYHNALLAAALVNLAAVGFGATPGKLIAPGIVEIQLKDGKPYNITCPPMFEKNVGDFFGPGDYEDMVASCIGADFDTNKGCDACLAAFVKTAFNKPRFSGSDDERQSQGTFSGNIPFAVIPQINFTNGCPFAQACKSSLVKTIDDDAKETEDTTDDALGQAFGEMIDKCTGPKPGPDYENAYKQVQQILQATNRTSSPAAGEEGKVSSTPSAASPVPEEEDASSSPVPEASGVPLPTAVLATAVAMMII